MLEDTKFYGKKTVKLLQIRLREEEFEEVVGFIKELGITQRNFLLRYLGVAKKIMSKKREKQKSKRLKQYHKNKGRG
ncbi:MAG: hypothetical protein WC508_05560 [Patescibacteria group bacterium]